MAKCGECGIRYNKADACSEFESHFDHEVDYDDDDEFSGLCADCAISRAESYLNVGRAIDMMNGDEDYDDDFVTHWL